MRNIAIVLACMACVGHGRRVQASDQLSLSTDEVGNVDDSNAVASAPGIESLAMLLAALNPADAFNPSGALSSLGSPAHVSHRTGEPAMQPASRRDLLSGTAAASAALLLGSSALPAVAEDGVTPEGVKYTVVKAATGGGFKPVNGDLVSIRFKGTVVKNGIVFDDILNRTDTYFTRLGSGNVLPGVESALRLMRPGDLWDLEIPGKLGFGEKGKPPTVGVPRIGKNEDLKMRLELVQVPGKDDEIIEQLGLGEGIQ